MRPVDKGSKPITYDFDLKTKMSGYTWTFKGKAVTAMFKTNKPTVRQCLSLWTQVSKSKYTKKPIVLSVTQRKLLNRIKEKVADTYKEACEPLGKRLGVYCSYCGMKLTEKPEVEHTVPKAPYPMFSLAWDNFLLSCSPCNGGAGKNNKPPRDTVKAWIGTNDPKEREYYNEIRKENYVWPDLDAKAYAWLVPDMYLYNATTGGWDLIKDKYAMCLNIDIQSQSAQGQYVNVDFTIGNQTYTGRIQVRLTPDSGISASQDMIDLCLLNQTNGTSPLYDMRILNRTLAWLKVLKQITLLRKLKDQTLFDMAWENLLNLAESTGFYHVYIRILDKFDLRDPGGKKLLDRFIQDTNNANFFPNTNTSNIPR